MRQQNQNYTDSSPNKKDAYNNAVTTAQGIIDQTTSPTLDPTVINQAAGQVSTTKNALNGNENLEAAKQQATQSLGSLDNLNNAQKQAVTDQINGAHTIDEANQIKQNAQNLNTAMGNLKQAIADKDATKATVNFTDADQAKQQAYNTAVTNAENIISKANGGNATQTEVEQAIQQVNAAKQALNGNANVQHAKDEATALINSSNDLNQAQKDALKQQVQNATTVAGVNNVKQTAQELNNAMTQLKQGIADKEQTKADGNFVNADPDKQNAYKQAVAKAEALISGTPDVVVTPSEITAALNKVTQAKNDLNGNTNLATTKQNVQHAIDQLPNLNQAQRDEYSKQITQATLVPNVNAIQQAATTLNDAMTQLKQGIANKAQIKGSENYHDADTDKQTAYDNAVTKAEELLKQTTNPTMDPNTIQQALTKVNDTNQALNGNQKLADAKQAAKTNLGTLDHLNDAQKQALTTQVEQAPDIATVNNVKQNAQNLNNAMTNLSNALQDKTETLNSINFTDADQAKKDAYTNAVAHAEGILSKANGSNASQTEVEQAMQRVNEAKQALNGNDNVQRAKDAAKQVITNANDLNQAQKDALKQQVDAAQTVANVNTIKQTAQDLNQAMTQLKQGIADKDQTKANGNFVNADTDKQNAYNNAVAHAEQIVSGTPNANVDPQQVAQALQQVTQAKGDLNGNHNLQVAKDNANTAIDQLPNLNQTQKTALKDQVSHAELVTGVNAIKQNADALNNAMGTLKQQIQANSQVPQSVDFTQADQDKQQAYNNAANQAQQIANGTPTPVLTPDAVTQAVTTMNQAKDALNGDEKLAQAKQDAIANLDTLRDLNQPQRDALRNHINQAQALATVEQTVDYTQADLDKQNAYKQAIADAENVLKQNANKQQVDQALQNILNAKQALNGDERVALAKTNGKHDIEQLNALNNAQQDGFKGRIDQSNDLNQIQQIVDEAKALNRVMDQLSQEITGNEGRTKGSTNYVNADTQVKQVYDEAVDKAKQALDKSTGQNLTAEQVIKLNDAVTAAKKALNGEEKLNNRKSEALQRLDQLTHLNNAQRQLAIQQINNAETLNKASRAINRATKLDNAMGAVQQYIDEQHLGVISSTNYINADDNLKANYDNAIANAAHELDKVQGNAIAKAEAEQLKQNIIDAQNALNGDQNLANAKDKANAFVNSLNGLNQQQQHLAHNAINNADTVSDVTDIVNNQIDLNDAMETLKHLVDNEIPNAEQTVNYQNAEDNAKTNFDDAKRLANTLLNSDNTNVNDINGAIQTVNDAIQNLNGDQRLQDAKDKAIQSINQALANKLKEIEASNATDQDKLIAKNKAEELANSIINNINKATSNQDVSQVQTAGNHAIEQVHANEIPKAKIDANKDVDKQVQALIDEIDRNPNLTDKEKQALKDRINQILQQGHNGINNAMTKEEIEHAKAQLAQALQDIKDLVKAKEDAKNAIKALANAKRDQINSNPDLTLEQKAKALKEIDEAEKRALENIENAQTKDQLNQGLNLGLDDIRNTHVWEVDAQPAVNEIFDATPEQILVNGELIVHRDDIITEQDILAHINLIDQLTAEIIDTPSTATISDSLTAKVEVTLLDGSKVIVNVPVKVVEKELTVVKQQAIESIENAAQQKINEINNHATLTPEQKEAAIAEVNKLKQQAIEQINNAADVHTVEEVQHQEQAHIEQFNPDQFTIDQAKSNAIKSISDAIQHMIDEINASKDLTDKEKQEAISKLNQLKDQSIQAIQRAQSIDEIAQQLEQFKAQLKAANPFAKELKNRKKAAISKIKDISTDKIDRIRNSTIGTAEERQAAMNRINEIVLETIKDINNAQTPQQVEAALNNGIARILAVQIVTSDHSKPSSNSDGQSNSHLHVGYGTVNHPFNSSPIGHKKKLDQDDEIDPLHMRHFGVRIGNVIKNALGVVGISGLLASFWFFIAKRRRKEDEEEELEIRDNSKDKKKGSIEGTKHLPLLFAKRRRKEDEEDVEVTNENTDEKVLQDNEHSPVLIAKRLKDKDGNVETTTSIESKDEDVPLLLAKKKNQKDNQSKGKKSASKKPSKKVAAKKKKKKSKKIKNNLFLR